MLNRPHIEMKLNQNSFKTVSKQFQNGFETVLFQFHFNVWTVLLATINMTRHISERVRLTYADYIYQILGMLDELHLLFVNQSG